MDMRLTKVLCGALIGLCACSGSEDFEQGEVAGRPASDHSLKKYGRGELFS